MQSLSQNRRRGKAVEKAIAKKLNGTRIGLLGREDIIHDKFSIEVKSRRSFVGCNWYDQAVRYAKDKIPIVVIHITNKRYDNDFVLIKLKDFLNIINPEGEKNDTQ